MPIDESTTPTVRYRSNHTGYRVGDDGSFWSCRLIGRRKGVTSVWRRLTPWMARGYPQVGIDKKRIHVHRLVLEAFVGPCPEGMECRHLDGDRTNNRLENLAWGTRKENTADSMRHGTFHMPPPGGGISRDRRGELNPRAKLRTADIPEIRRLSESGRSQKSLGRQFGVGQGIICRILRGELWGHV